MEAHTMLPAPPPQRVKDMVELVEEILLRLPSGEPDSLVRAAVVCKPWRRLLSSHRFRRLYRDFHKKPPMLGFFQNCLLLGSAAESTFDTYLTTKGSLLAPASTNGFLPRDPDGRYGVFDCRHGRVLLKSWDYDNCWAGVSKYVVWDPMKGSQRPLLTPYQRGGVNHGVAVLCAVGDCDHSACHMGPFHVVYITVDNENELGDGAWAYVYSSKTRKWSERAFLQLPGDNDHDMDKRPFVLLVAEALFSLIITFTPTKTRQVIKYDLGDKSLSIFNVPPMVADWFEIPPALVTAEDGGLGLAHVDKFGLHLWSYDDGVAEWTLDRVIDLNKMSLPIGDPMIAPQVAGAVEGTRTIFVVTDLGAYMIDLNSLTSKKLSQEICSSAKEKVVFHVFPYLSFFNRPDNITGGGAASIRRSKQNRRPNPKYL